MTTAKTTGFSWDESNTEKATALYSEMVAEHGAEYANENLKEIAKTLGAKSAAAVRSKLVSAKVYVKADTPRKVGGGSSLRKIHFVRAFVAEAEERGIEVDPDSFDSLESAKMSTLKLVAELAGVKVTAAE